MADHFVDSTTGNNADSGHTMDLAWATLEYAMESGTLTAGDIVWVRRVHSEIPTSDIQTGYSGSTSASIKIIGWPRNSLSITSSDWENGSTSVTIDDGGMDREQHLSRYITAPNGETYFITRITSSTGIVIDREYAGTTVTNSASTIQADEDYALAQTIDDSGWTITKTNYNGDANDLPLIDFNAGNFQFYYNNMSYCELKNMRVANSTDSNGLLFVNNSYVLVTGCLLSQNSNAYIANINNSYGYFKRTVIEGSGSGANQRGLQAGGCLVHADDVAIYNCGNNGINSNTGSFFFKKVNIGVEVANASVDISMGVSFIQGRDIKLGGSNGYVTFGRLYAYKSNICIENYQRVLGAHRTFFPGGYYEKQAVPDSTIVNKKVSDNVIKIVPNVNSAAQTFNNDTVVPIFVHEFDVTDISRTYKYWIFNNAFGTINDTTALDNIYLQAEYIAIYDDTSEYSITSTYSTEIDIANAATADDWDYLQLTVDPATSGRVRITLFWRGYSATGTIYIDPAVVIS